MTEPAAPELWCVVHVHPEAQLRPLAAAVHYNAVIQLTAPFYRWDLAVEWAAATFPDDRDAEVLPFHLLPPEFEDEAAALGQVEPTAWVLCHRDDPHRALVAAVGPFVNRRIAYADLALHAQGRYAGHLALMAEFGTLDDTRLTGGGTGS